MRREVRSAGLCAQLRDDFGVTGVIGSVSGNELGVGEPAALEPSGDGRLRHATGVRDGLLRSDDGDRFMQYF